MGILLVLDIWVLLVRIDIQVLVVGHEPTSVVLLELILLEDYHRRALLKGLCLVELVNLLMVIIGIGGLGLLPILRNERGRGWLFRIFLSGLLHCSATSVIVD